MQGRRSNKCLEVTSGCFQPGWGEIQRASSCRVRREISAGLLPPSPSSPRRFPSKLPVTIPGALQVELLAPTGSLELGRGRAGRRQRLLRCFWRKRLEGRVLSPIGSERGDRRGLCGAVTPRRAAAGLFWQFFTSCYLWCLVPW